MLKVSTPIKDCEIMYEPNIFNDNRGHFVKAFSSEVAHFTPNYDEVFWSINPRFTARGLHNQRPHSQIAKLVICIKGMFDDYVIDARSMSPSYRNAIIVRLKEGEAIYVPANCYHGFTSLEDNTTVLYIQEGTYDKKEEIGANFSSFGFVSPLLINGITISDKDRAFPEFKIKCIHDASTLETNKELPKREYHRFDMEDK